MNRRNFLQGLASIVPATLLAKIALPKVEATVEAVEETPAREWKNLSVDIDSSNPLSVIVSAGYAVVDGVLYTNDAPLRIPIPSNDTPFHRIDAVVLRKDWTKLTVRAAIKKGEASLGARKYPKLDRSDVLYDHLLKWIDVYPTGRGTELIQDETA